MWLTETLTIIAGEVQEALKFKSFLVVHHSSHCSIYINIYKMSKLKPSWCQIQETDKCKMIAISLPVLESVWPLYETHWRVNSALSLIEYPSFGSLIRSSKFFHSSSFWDKTIHLKNYVFSKERIVIKHSIQCTWIYFLKVKQNWYSILIFLIKLVLWIKDIFLVIWSQNTDTKLQEKQTWVDTKIAVIVRFNVITHTSVLLPISTWCLGK